MFGRRPTVTGPFPSGVKPDGVSDDQFVLIKACRQLRLTGQIRLAAFMAHEQKKRLLLVVRKDCAFTGELQGFLEANSTLVEIKRA